MPRKIRPKYSEENVAAIACFLDDCNGHFTRAIAKLKEMRAICVLPGQKEHIAYYESAQATVAYMLGQLAHAKGWAELNKRLKEGCV